MTAFPTPHLSAASLLATVLTAPALAQDATPPGPDPAAILAEAPADHWRPIPVSDLLVMTLAPDAQGNRRELVIQLLPAQLSGGHVRNVRKLAGQGYWNGTLIYRVAPDFVTQFGGNPVAKPTPDNLESVPESEYYNAALGEALDRDTQALAERMTYANAHKGAALEPLSKIIWEREAQRVGFAEGWPVGVKDGKAYPITCCGSLSPAHYDPPDTGSGTEISIVTAEAARSLDTTFGFVGRVIDGLEHAVDLPKGDDGWGFYDDKAKMTGIVSIAPASALPIARQPQFEYLASWSPVLLAYWAAQEGYNNICSAPYPVRRVAR